jgi:hypothetical protein
VQAHYAAAFDREQGVTEPEWRQMLAAALDGHAWRHVGPGQVEVAVGEGWLRLSWSVLPPRQIASIRLPRLGVRYRFEQVSEEQRQAFMKRFDLHIQRGGG